MTRRLIASLVLVSTLATSCIPFTEPKDQPGYGTNWPFPEPTPSHGRDSYDDHSSDKELALTLGLGAAGIGLLIAIIVMANRGHSAERPVAAPPPLPKEVVFAPIPASAATEGDQLRLQRMYAQGQLLARVGRCDGVITIGRVIYQNDPAYYAQYIAEPSIAGCAVDKLSIRN